MYFDCCRVYYAWFFAPKCPSWLFLSSSHENYWAECLWFLWRSHIGIFYCFSGQKLWLWWFNFESFPLIGCGIYDAFGGIFFWWYRSIVEHLSRLQREFCSRSMAYSIWRFSFYFSQTHLQLFWPFRLRYFWWNFFEWQWSASSYYLSFQRLDC